MLGLFCILLIILFVLSYRLRRGQGWLYRVVNTLWSPAGTAALLALLALVLWSYL